MATIVDFKAKLTAYSTAVKTALAENAISIAVKAQQTAAFRTPVDTGAAKDSWNVSSPVANLNFKDRRAGYFNPAGPTLGEVTLAGFRLGMPIHVSNHVPYIKLINDTHGSKPHFYETTVADILAGVIR